MIIACVMIASLFFNLSKLEFICLIFAFVLIIFAEMVNTAIETVVDLYTDLYHPKAKIAKDVAAGAVVIAALNALIITYFIQSQTQYNYIIVKIKINTLYTFKTKKTT